VIFGFVDGIPRLWSGEVVAFGVGYVVVLADFRPPVCIPFLLFTQALLSVLLKSLHVGDGAGDPKVVVVVELIEVGVERGRVCAILWFDVVT
jgi:hypothetical protein